MQQVLENKWSLLYICLSAEWRCNELHSCLQIVASYCQIECVCVYVHAKVHERDDRLNFIDSYGEIVSFITAAQGECGKSNKT